MIKTLVLTVPKYLYINTKGNAIRGTSYFVRSQRSVIQSVFGLTAIKSKIYQCLLFFFLFPFLFSHISWWMKYEPLLSIIWNVRSNCSSLNALFKIINGNIFLFILDQWWNKIIFIFYFLFNKFHYNIVLSMIQFLLICKNP